MSFANLGGSRPVADALKGRRIVAPFPIQELVISDVLAGHDVLVHGRGGAATPSWTCERCAVTVSYLPGRRIDYEIERDPKRTDGAIAKSLGSSVPAVVKGPPPYRSVARR